MNVLIVGCGRVGIELIERLQNNNHFVTVVDDDPEAFFDLPSDFRGRIIEGEALNQDTLVRAGIEDADGIALVTSSDAVNAVVAHVARTYYNVANIVVRNFDSRWRPLHEIFGHQVISSSSWGAQRIEELLYHIEGQAVFSAGNGEVELYEYPVPHDWDGRLVKDVTENEEFLIAAITRAGKAILPAPETMLNLNDILLVSATLRGSIKIKQQIG